jgi:hypothetical protein
MLPIRLTKEAVLNQSVGILFAFVLHCSSLDSGKPITKYKTAIIQIKDFKPMLRRIPIGKGKLTSEGMLALDCNYFQTVGSFGEVRFGNPKAIEKHLDLNEWSEGLRQDGGAGYDLAVAHKPVSLMSCLETAS